MHESTQVEVGSSSYIQISRNVRESLVFSLQRDGWPPLPMVKSMEELLAEAKKSVTDRWQTNAQDILTERLLEWRKILAPRAQEPQIAALLSLLEDPSSLEKRLAIQQLRPFSALSEALPEAWQTLLMLSSERQFAAVMVLRHWIRTAQSDPLQAEQIEQSTGFSLQELSLYLDLTGAFGKYIDHAYLKQTEIAGLPGSSSQTEIGSLQGGKYLYDQKGREGTHVKTYTHMFPYEWPRMVRRIAQLAEHIDLQIQQGTLPSSYGLLPDYLRCMAEAYGSDEINPLALDHLHDETLDKFASELAKSGCPLVIMRQNDPSLSDKVDIEMRIGLRTPEAQAMETILASLQRYVQEYIDHHKSAFAAPYTVPPQYITMQLGFGPNLSAMTRGEGTRLCIFTHANSIKENATAMELPVVRALFVGIEDVSDEDYAQASVLDTAVHEYAHQFAVSTDASIQKRLGNSSEKRAIEELKADTGGMKLVLRAMHDGIIDTKRLRAQLLAKIGDACEYLKRPSTDRYYLSGIVIIGTLLEHGILELEGERYRIVDATRGVQVLGEVADRLLETLYVRENATPEDVLREAHNLRALEAEDPMQAFLRRLGSL